MKLFKIIFGSFILSFLTACQSENGSFDIRDYYFPVEKLEEGLVYEYQAQDNSPAGPAYWYYRSIQQEGQQYLTGTYYETDLIPQQLSNELVTEAGMVLQDLYLYEKDSLSEVQTQIPVKVIEDDIFPFNVRKEGGIFLYHITWESPVDSNTTYSLIKNRRYLRDTTFTFQDKKYSAQLFELKELITHDQNGVWEQEYDGIEIYAKDLGLVYYSREINEELFLRYRLADRYPMVDLEEKFRQLYGE